jgi:DNA-binding transcriptional ArsR family regulator
MEELEKELNRAIEAFLAAIMRAVERAAIAALRAAWAGSSQAGDARASTMEAELTAGRARRRETAASVARTPRPAPTPTDTAALVGRIVACVGAQPGATVMQLAPHVGIHETTLRRHLHRLADDGLIRIEERASTRFGGQPTRAYFAIERAEAAQPEPVPLRAEAA